MNRTATLRSFFLAAVVILAAVLSFAQQPGQPPSASPIDPAAPQITVEEKIAIRRVVPRDDSHDPRWAWAIERKAVVA